ncbi:RDD family protein [Niabella hirudinis]|uniref:RDD family protein n=1 Tax=Niabella hirudinis TaxID=1285929 RepID=UPI003EBB575E
MTDKEYSTFTGRILASLIDLIPFGLLSLINFVVILPLDTPAAHTTNLLITFIFPFFYYIYLQYRFGKTYGKWVMKLKIINTNPSKKPTLQQILIRELGYIILHCLPYVNLIRGHDYQPSVIQMPALADSYLSIILAVYFTADILTLLFSPKRRALHDLISGTLVIREQRK